MEHAWSESKRDALRTALRRHICSICLDVHDDGSCGLAEGPCALENHFERIVDAVAVVGSSRMDDYVAAVREHVCAKCPTQDPAGFCARREGGGCALDSYLSLVVDAVEEVLGPLPRTP